MNILGAVIKDTCMKLLSSLILNDSEVFETLLSYVLASGKFILKI